MEFKHLVAYLQFIWWSLKCIWKIKIFGNTYSIFTVNLKDLITKPCGSLVLISTQYRNNNIDKNENQEDRNDKDTNVDTNTIDILGSFWGIPSLFISTSSKF